MKKYKEFTEERAKKLYEELLIQYIKSSRNEVEEPKRLEQSLENNVV